MQLLLSSRCESLPNEIGLTDVYIAYLVLQAGSTRLAPARGRLHPPIGMQEHQG